MRPCAGIVPGTMRSRPIALTGKVAFSQVNRHHARRRPCPGLVVCLDDVPWPGPVDARPMSGPAAENVYDVIVIGAGPVGLCLSLALAQEGVPVTLIEALGDDNFLEQVPRAGDPPGIGHRDNRPEHRLARDAGPV